MAVSSIKGCWCKFSARIREYLDVVDSYYRTPEELAVAVGLADAAKSTAAHKQKQHLRITGNHCNKSNHNHHRYTNGGTQLISSATSPRSGGQQVTTTNTSNKTSSGRSKLPPGFSKKKSSQGQIFFVASNGEKFWYDPSVPKELIDTPLDLDCLVGKLSSNWEIRHTNSGKTYYVNHLKKTTQFTDPRLIAHKDYLHDILRHAKRSRTSPNERAAVSPPAYQATNITNKHHVVSSNLAGGGSQQFSLFARPRPATTNVVATAVTANIKTNINNNSQPQSEAVRSICSSQPVDSRSDRAVSVNRQTHHHHHHHHYHNHGSLNRTKNVAAPRPADGHIDRTGGVSSVCRPNQSLNNYSRLQNQCHPNLLSVSQHNLSTSEASASVASCNTQHQSATLTRIPGLKSTRVHGDENGGDLSPSCDSSQTTSKVRSNHHQQQRSGSFANLTSLSANSNVDINNSDLVEEHQFIHSDYKQQQLVSSKVNHNELFDKISILRQELLKQQVIAHPCRIDVNRKRIFEESFRVVSQLQPRDLKKRLLVKFKGEEGLDYGGVAREWFYLLSREILNPAHGLFQYTSDDIYNLQINPDSGIVYKEHLSYLNFCGRIIGMAVFHGHFIEGHFTLPFYKMLLRKPISLGDIEFVDPELYRSLCWMLENDITDVIDTTFLVQHNAFGQLQELELKDGGRNITVTEENKHEYVSLYVNYRCRRGIESQMEALQRGFYELILPSLVENFNEAELELLIGGLSKINIEDWKRHTKLKNCTVESPLVEWFWDIVRSYGEDKRARLLQFVTGSPRVPIQGFKALQGFNSEPRLFTIHLIRNACTDNLPKSHTCFNRIDLPPYETYDKLRDKLTQAIEETMGFAMQ